MVLSFNPSTGQLLQSLALTAVRSSRQLLLVLLFQNVPRVGGDLQPGAEVSDTAVVPTGSEAWPLRFDSSLEVIW